MSESKTKKTLKAAPKKAKAPKARSKKKKAPARKKTLDVINVKMSKATRSALKSRAKKFAKGNLSAFLRHAGLKYTPRKGEKISLDA